MPQLEAGLRRLAGSLTASYPTRFIGFT